MSHSVLSLHLDEISGAILSDNVAATLGWGKLRYRGSPPLDSSAHPPLLLHPKVLPQTYLQPEQHIP